MPDLQLNMDFAPSEEQDALVAAITSILEDVTTMERLKEVDADPDWFDRVAWQEVARADLLGVTVPEAHGGLGYGILDVCLLLEQVGRCVAPGPYLPTVVTSLLIARHGSDDQQARLLPGVAAGDTVVTVALSEVAGEPDAPTTTATADGDGWVLDGVKVCVPYASVATAVVVAATAADGVVLALVDPNAPGVTLTRQSTMGHEPWFEVRLEAVRVGATDVIARGSAAAETLEWLRQHLTVAQCAVAAGVADRSVRLTAEYTTTRKQFDRAIGTFQAVGQRMADAYIDAQAMRLTMLLAATRLHEGRDAPLEVATAKFWASDGGHRVGHAALHVHGGISIDLDYPIHRYFLWQKQLEFALGPATPQLVRIGRILADTPVPA